jgi:tyrosine-protein kinase Etk/Wzc
MRAEIPPLLHEPGLLDLARVLLPRWRSLVALPILVGALALAASFLMSPVFVATARVLPPQQQGGAAAMLAQQLGALSLLAGAAGFKNPADQFVALLKSRSIADRLIERHRLREVYDVELHEDARRALDDNSSIVVGKEGLIVVEVADLDPKRAADLANGYVEELRRMTRQMSLDEASQRREFFESQLATARDRLAAAEIALKRSAVPWRRSHGSRRR